MRENIRKIMSRGTEKIFRKMRKAMEGKNIESEDAYDYLEMAQDAEDEKEALKYARKALELDPLCLDAEVLIAQIEADTPDEFKEYLEVIIEKGEQLLAEQGITKEEDVGHFYGILETRAYMRARGLYIEHLIAMGRFRKAICEAEEVLTLNENDNLGVRYTLMALYANYEEEEKAQKLFEKYEEDTAFMLMPLIALYYKLDDMEKMRTYIVRLKVSTPEVLEALKMLISPDDEEILEIANQEMFRPFSLEEVILSISKHVFLYMSLQFFIPCLCEEFFELEMDDDDYYGEDDEADFYANSSFANWEEYEQKSEEIRQRNEQYLNIFARNLENADLAGKTISKHLDNVDFYINEFLLREDLLEMKDGCGVIINEYLGYFYIHKCMWSTPNNIKTIAASIKKFYKSMLDHGYVEKSAYKELCDEIKKNMSEWQQDCERFNDYY